MTKTSEFQELIWAKSRELYRDMPWRDEPTFYRVLVSELMLQQTQVPRVLVKFAEFMQTFPTIETLARARLADVLRVWTGLGYNRRAKFLHEAAKIVAANGAPATIDELVKLPGVGRNTAAAIMNYVYETPTAYVETNIRTIYFHYFFADRADISDAELLGLVEQTMDCDHPREWFWGLMDYGAYLKQTAGGCLDKSRHYKKQPPLRGSVREVRGQIVRALSQGSSTEYDLRQKLHADKRFDAALSGLKKDGLVSQTNDQLHLTN